MNIIKEMRLQSGISQVELAKICCVHQTAVSQWEKGRTNPDNDSLAKLSDFFGVTIDKMLGRESESGRPISVPVLGYIRAGVPIEAVEDILDYEEITPEMARSGDIFALKIRGDSMQPRICDGDVVIVRQQSDADSGDVVAVLINGTDATVKKIIKKGTSIMLVPFNPEYEPIVFTKQEIKNLPVAIIGKVVELRGKF